MKYIKWFKDLRKVDIVIAGGKGANLGELTSAGIPVPPGFVVLSSAYFAFLDHNQIRLKLHKLLSAVDVSDSAQLQKASLAVKHLLDSAVIPSEIAREIFLAYARLSQGKSRYSVAVRSSATAEDLPDASFAGQQESFLNITGDANVVLKVKQCWLSLFSPRSIFYRVQKKFDHFKVGIAVPVQQMIQSEVSGVMFTVNPITLDKDNLVIEAAYGLGDYIVQGVVTPDHYEISKSSGHILQKRISIQKVMETKTSSGVKSSPVPVRLQDKQKLSDHLILQLANLGKQIHRHYFFPQDIEWALAKGSLYITQSRPITTLVSEKPQAKNLDQLGQLEILLKGAPASPGLVTGHVRLVPDIRNLSRVKPGDILVTDMTTPDFVPAMKTAAGIVTNRGGQTSHAAIVSRELGVPCVVGTSTATKILTDGMVVTVNGTTGEIFKGGLIRPSVQLPSAKSGLPPPDSRLKTATKVFVNLAEPDLAPKIASTHVDGVGLLRAEFMIAGIGIHPKKLIADGKSRVFINRLARDLTVFCREFNPRPVIYRATDFKTNEYRSLKGGDKFEPVESNPMLGFRGAYRYIKNPDVFNLELEAIKQVRQKHQLKNLHLMIPFVSHVRELVEVKKLVASAGLYRSSSFRLYMMVEIPANVILLDDFIDVGIDGVSIGSNDLTMLILGVDRDNAEVASQFSELDPAVLWALKKTVTTCARRGISCGICGQAPSDYPDLVEKLVTWGIDSISVNPDAIARTREIVYHSELKLLNKKTPQS
ncbi:MAG: Phosphoenolpyruvate synthase [Candidatus Amesbacteria bacterium GW2011_GWC1_48_10]|uniref:Phosphoenolpyruvate synthase n=1 Tax=Candidatus Amesbacteria bacterium GW2011_GWC1_48_10 TaxID=1618365 RepID=A0A0G1UGH1_9BACT|nr:MAG: Phosphoenolpyruvate synthase [Candidatus Amesbacteria bacterium GW2011_GWC1_48_10]OGC98712.1 MAG: phosphoenolpyruvate synthase [Candidatus Amesbacteria bacterium RBG_16_48_31]